MIAIYPLQTFLNEAMGNMKTHIVTVFLFFQLFSANLHAQVSSETTQVLLINSINQDMPWQKSVEVGLRAELTRQAFDFDLFVENMDVGRFDEVQQKKVMKLYLQQKYQNRKIDIIVTQSVSAAALLTEFYGFFPDVPKIYLEPGANFTVPESINTVTINAKLDYKQATQDAVNLINPKELIVILDTTNDMGRNFYQNLLPVIGNDFPHLRIEKWFDVPTETLINKINNAPSDAIVLFTPIFRKYKGKQLSPFQFVKLLTSDNQAPIFSYWHALLGSGIVGGYLLSGETIGNRIAESIIFFKENKSLKPIDDEKLSAHYYDWRQLKKFKIDPQRLPQGSMLSYYEPTYFEENKMLIYSAIIIILTLSSFLMFFLILNSKRVQLLKELDSEKLKLEFRVEQRTKELLTAKDEAEHLALVKSEFLANMSHEIRTPMNGVIGLTNILLESELPLKQRQYLDKIKYSSDQLLIVINDILDFSKIESGNTNLEEFPFSVNAVVDYIKTTFENQAQDKGIKFIVNVASNVPPDLVGDVVRINQVLLNLCSNAIKFTSHGKVSVCIHAEQILNDDESILIHFIVKDSGIGIAPQNVSHLFDAFTQEDSSTTRNFGGTGLGLTISRRLCKLMGGDISVVSTQHLGSEFTASVKVNKKIVIADSFNSIQTSILDSKNSANHPSLIGLKVLVAEDNEINKLVITAMLEKKGVVIHLVDNGFECIQAHKSQQFDLILMDIHMPIMDGIEASKMIRNDSDKTIANIPIIALTANVMENDIAYYLSVGMNAHVAKPTKASELYRIIEQCLKSNSDYFDKTQ
ncbi:ATP-binding protein [Pseudoalteromonas fuliginea]|uniref:ATP-binding protein n=1 Tax=Pseudoalteromonas fuliginea TaxID=1872678 RepID=UPI003177D791